MWVQTQSSLPPIDEPSPAKAPIAESTPTTKGVEATPIPSVDREKLFHEEAQPDLAKTAPICSSSSTETTVASSATAVSASCSTITKDIEKYSDGRNLPRETFPTCSSSAMPASGPVQSDTPLFSKAVYEPTPFQQVSFSDARVRVCEYSSICV